MTTMFLIATSADAGCAAQISQDLSSRGYAVHTAPAAGSAAAHDWQQTLNASAAVLLVWSVAASADARVAEYIKHARWLYKRLLVVASDDTALPVELATAPLVRSNAPCSDAVAQLQTHLPFNAAEDLLDDLLRTLPRSDAPAPRSAATHVFGVRCKNGHVSYFDKREVCRHAGVIKRTVRDGKTLDELHLRCTTCGASVVADDVDCEGYR